MRLRNDGVIDGARLVFMSVGDQPVDAAAAAGLLAGESPSEALYEAAAVEAAEKEIEPAGTIHATPDFTRHLVAVLTRRALTLAVARAQEASE